MGETGPTFLASHCSPATLPGRPRSWPRLGIPGAVPQLPTPPSRSSLCKRGTGMHSVSKLSELLQAELSWPNLEDLSGRQLGSHEHLATSLSSHAHPQTSTVFSRVTQESKPPCANDSAMHRVAGYVKEQQHSGNAHLFLTLSQRRFANSLVKLGQVHVLSPSNSNKLTESSRPQNVKTHLQLQNSYSKPGAKTATAQQRQANQKSHA